MAAKPGDTVRITLPDEVLEGVLMPTPEYQKGTMVLKLESGYNVGIDEKRIKKTEVVTAFKEGAAKTTAGAKQQKGLPKITILHTGGTIASKVDYRTGGVVARFTPAEILELFPELGEIAQVESRLVANMWSEDMRFAHYNIMAKEVEKERKAGAAGVIITHGTDTLHYSSAALAFILENIDIPVLLVGAQRSSDRGSSDAGMNLLCASLFIAEQGKPFNGVGVCMHENMSDEACLILPPCKTRKMHTSRRDAFRPISATPIARVDFQEKTISIIDKTAKQWQQPAGKPALRLFDPNLKVGLLKCHTNMYASEVTAYKGFDGLLVEATGLGQAPVNEIDEHTKENGRVKEALRDLVKAGTIVAFAPQTIYGRLHMDVYQPGRELQALGVLGHLSDMTPETSFIKLAWLLSTQKDKDKIKDLFMTDLCGELSAGSGKDGFLN